MPSERNVLAVHVADASWPESNRSAPPLRKLGSYLVLALPRRDLERQTPGRRCVHVSIQLDHRLHRLKVAKAASNLQRCVASLRARIQTVSALHEPSHRPDVPELRDRGTLAEWEQEEVLWIFDRE